MHDGVLEITVPMVKVEAKHRTLEIAEPTPVKTTKAGMIRHCRWAARNATHSA